MAGGEDALGKWPQEFDDLLRRHSRFVEPGEAIDPGATLPELRMNSLEVVELIVDLGNRFDFSVPESLLTPEVFAGPSTIWDAVGPFISRLAETNTT